MAIREQIQAEGVKHLFSALVACVVAIGASIAVTHDNRRKITSLTERVENRDIEIQKALDALKRVEDNQQLTICLLQDQCDPRSLYKIKPE